MTRAFRRARFGRVWISQVFALNSRTFFSSGMDALVIGCYLVTKADGLPFVTRAASFVASQ